MLGVAICLAVCVVFWPETASEGLGRALSESLDTSRTLLNLSTRSFLLNHKAIALPKSVIENAKNEMREAQKKLLTAYQEARYEVTFATTDPAEYKEVRVIVSALMRHLASMSLVFQNERLLMLGHPDRSNEDLMTESEYESDSNDDGSSGGYESDDNTSTDSESSHSLASTDRKSVKSEGMSSTGNRSKSRKHKRGSAAELRRIRQLFMRAEMSTEEVMNARRAQMESEQRRRESQSQSTSPVIRRNSTVNTSTNSESENGLSGTRRRGAFERVSKHRFSIQYSTTAEESGPSSDPRNPSLNLPLAGPSSPTPSDPSRLHHSSTIDKGVIGTSQKSSCDLHSRTPSPKFKSHPATLKQRFNSRKKSRKAKRRESNTNSILSTDSGPGLGIRIPLNPIDSLPVEAQDPGDDEDNGAGVGSDPGGFSEKAKKRPSFSGSLPEDQMQKVAKAFRERRRQRALKRSQRLNERMIKAEKKRLAKEKLEQCAFRNVPPKEVVFGDRKLFLSFLHVVRKPLQRLSDSCARSMATMERELVMGLNVEKDMEERIKKRKLHRESIVKRAAAEADGHPAISDALSPAAKSSQPNHSGNNESTDPASWWQRFLSKIRMKSRLTQGEKDFMDAIKKFSRKNGKRTTAGSKIPADSIHPRKIVQSPAVSHSESVIDVDDGESILPGDVSTVQYLTLELEIFDHAESSGLQEFITQNPSLDVGPREEIFLIFFFIFTMREIARELLRLGKHMEKLRRRQELLMERGGLKKPRRRLWWPKVIGNFDRWFAWGNYAQNRVTEGFTAMAMHPKKGHELGKPRMFSEEKAHLEAKAARVAEKEAREIEAEKALKEKMEDENNQRQAGRLKRSVTMSALFTRVGSQLARSEKQTVTPEVQVQPLSLVPDELTTVAPYAQDGTKTKGKEPLRRQQYTVIDIPDYQSLHASKTLDPKAGNVSPMDVPLIESRPAPSHPSILTESAPLDMDEVSKSFAVQKNSNRHIHSGSHKKRHSLSSQSQSSQIPPATVTLTDLCTKDDESMDSNDSAGDELVNDIVGYYVEQPTSGQQTSVSASKNSSRPSEQYSAPDQKSSSHSESSHNLPTRTMFENAPKQPKTFRYRLWESLQEFKSDEVRYGLKMASALTLVGLWAWLGWTSQLLAMDRGQWVMMTIVAVLSPTIGATFGVCLWRIGGTLIGIVWAMLTYLACPMNPYVILAMMLVLSSLVVYCILLSTHPIIGIIMMLSYNSIVFGIYHGQTTDGIYATSYKVAVTMIIGILISVILNTFLWPVLARRELRKEIAILIGCQGILFAELINKYLLEEPTPRERQRAARLEKRAMELTEEIEDRHHLTVNCQLRTKEGSSDKRNPEPTGNEESLSVRSGLIAGSGQKVTKHSLVDPLLIEDMDEACNDEDIQEKLNLDADRLAFQKVEHQLQTKLIKIYQLLELSEKEPRLKGTFPKELYKQIVQCCQNILDRMVSMRMTAQLLSIEVRDLVTGPMNYYRRDMVGALLLYFSVLSSSLASKTPLPPYLPSARLARLRVIYLVRQAISAHQEITGKDQYTYIYYYAYSSALEEVIEELELLAILIKPLVGVTVVSASQGNRPGVTADQLSLLSAIPSIQLSVPPLQPSDTAILTDVPADVGTDHGPASNTEIPNPNIIVVDPSGKASVPVQVEGQPIKSVDLDLILPSERSKIPGEDASKEKNTTVSDAKGREEVLKSSPSLRQKKSQRQCPTSPMVPPIVTQPKGLRPPATTVSPVMVVDQSLLDNRHLQRFKEAIETANEVSSMKKSSSS
ncbi:hypothetical protein FBU30_006443 [Linnemannia zychae]|nr:hypothetical protein FBU30_006443 [Linnemannia zychae]